jgi:hypothetical protein
MLQVGATGINQPANLRTKLNGKYVEIAQQNNESHEGVLNRFRPEVEMEHFSIQATNCLTRGGMSEHNGLSWTGKC